MCVCPKHIFVIFSLDIIFHRCGFDRANGVLRACHCRDPCNRVQGPSVFCSTPIWEAIFLTSASSQFGHNAHPCRIYASHMAAKTCNPFWPTILILSTSRRFEFTAHSTLRTKIQLLVIPPPRIYISTPIHIILELLPTKTGRHLDNCASLSQSMLGGGSEVHKQ